MGVVAPRQVHWFNHVNAVRPPGLLRPWLIDRVSLTTKLVARSKQFRVQALQQRRALCLDDEHERIGLPRRLQVWERDVLLKCDGHAVVYAHTVVPLGATTDDWPFFRSLGNRSLGSALFSDPLIQRGQLQFARLPQTHPLMKRIAATLGGDAASNDLYARRCLYRRKRGHLLVTEVFLPAIEQLPTAMSSQKHQQQYL